MGIAFLSPEWFEEAERIRAEIDPPVPEVLRGLTINLVVTGGPFGDVEARMEDGRFLPGRSPEAPTTLRVPYAVAYRMFILRDQAAGMQAFMSGQIQIEGDMTKIMMLQAAGPPSEASLRVQERIRAITDPVE